jgi:hypothetical protein
LKKGDGMANSESLKNTFVGIAGAVGGTCVGIVFIIAFFAREHMMISAYVCGALAAMGLGLGYLAAQSKGGDLPPVQ